MPNDRRAVAETSSLKADVLRALQPGDLPTITSTQDGTVQLLTNNNSGDEMQLRKDGTFTFVNGGDSPGIFSVSALLSLAQHPFPNTCLRASKKVF